MIILSVRDIVKYEQAAIKKGVASLTLIENAARALFRETRGFESVRIFCGKGNNGSDGYALAALLREVERDVEVVEVLPPSSSEAKTLSALCAHSGVKITPFDSIGDAHFDCYVDAIFGIGISGKVHGIAADAIRYINEHSPFTICADIPSGIDADSGEVCGCAVRADLTLTFTALKLGMVQGKGADYLGHVKCAEVGITLPVRKSGFRECITGKMASSLLPVRSKYSHKGTFGKVLIIAGSPTMPGAAALAAKAAYRAGCGLVRVATPKCNIPIIAALVPEAIYSPLPDSSKDISDALIKDIEGADAVLMGPGLGNTDYILKAARNCQAPLILDADALTSIASDISGIDGRNVCLTPHPGEFSRISGLEVAAIESARHGCAEAFCKEHNLTLLLKGSNSIVASPLHASRTCLLSTSALATAGSGDVCGGIIAAFAAAGLSLFDAASLAVYIHARAGIIAEEKLTAYSVTASDIIDNIPYAIKDISTQLDILERR